MVLKWDGPPVNQPSSPEAIAAYVADNGGGTFDATGWPVEPANGYAVGMAPGFASILPGSATPLRLATAMRRVQQEWESRFVGVWVTDDGKLAIDPVRILTYKGAALDLARDNAQRAIWGFAEGVAIEVAP